MTVIAFSTFLKCLELSTPDKTRQYGLYDQPGGRDFYQPLKSNTLAVAKGTKSWAAAATAVLRLSGAERQHNSDGLFTVQDWVQKKGGALFAPPEGLMRSPSRLLTVRLKPELGIAIKGSRYVVALWNTRNPILTGR